MSENEHPRSRPLSLSAIVAMNHEERMAQLTKPPREGDPFNMETNRLSSGTFAGRTFGKLAVRPDENEDWPKYLGRVTSMLDEMDSMLALHDALQVQRELRASVKAGELEAAKS